MEVMSKHFVVSQAKKILNQRKLKQTGRYTRKAAATRCGKLFPRPTMLSDDSFSFWVGGNLCRAKLIDSKDFYILVKRC